MEHILPSLDGVIDQGLACLERGELDEAEERLRSARERAPDRAEPWFGLARIYLLRGEPAAALNALRGGLDRDPANLPAYELLGRLGYEGGVADIAIDRLEQGLESLPYAPSIVEWLIRLYALDGRDGDLAQGLAYYARLRDMTLPEVGLLFQREGALVADVRARIAAAVRG